MDLFQLSLVSLVGFFSHPISEQREVLWTLNEDVNGQGSSVKVFLNLNTSSEQWFLYYWMSRPYDTKYSARGWLHYHATSSPFSVSFYLHEICLILCYPVWKGTTNSDRRILGLTGHVCIFFQLTALAMQSWFYTLDCRWTAMSHWSRDIVISLSVQRCALHSVLTSRWSRNPIDSYLLSNNHTRTISTTAATTTTTVYFTI